MSPFSCAAAAAASVATIAARRPMSACDPFGAQDAPLMGNVDNQLEAVGAATIDDTLHAKSGGGDEGLDLVARIGVVIDADVARVRVEIGVGSEANDELAAEALAQEQPLAGHAQEPLERLCIVR